MCARVRALSADTALSSTCKAVASACTCTRADMLWCGAGSRLRSVGAVAVADRRLGACLCLQELMRDQPMPALTALQQLQLRQLQEQSSAVIQAQQQQQQVAAIVAQQQQAAEQLRALQQQRGLLAAGGVAAGASYTGMMAL